MVPLTFLSNFFKTREMPLTNCEINVILTCCANCVTASITVTNQSTTFSVTDTKLYAPVVTLSTQDNTKLL